MREKLRLNWIWSTFFLLILFVYVQFYAPNEPIDPWGLFQIKKLGFIFFAISITQYLSFFFMGRLGGHVGMVLAGFFGGIISSTAVSISSAHLSSDHPQLQRLPAASVMSAAIAMVAEALMILAIGAPDLCFHVLPSLLAMIVTGVIAISILFHRGKSKYDVPHPQSPLDLFEVFTFTLMIGFLILVVGLGRLYLGATGVKALTFFASLFEVHGVLVAHAQLYMAGRIETETGHQVIMLALTAAFLSKIGIVWWLGARRFALMASLGLLAMLMAGSTLYMLL